MKELFEKKLFSYLSCWGSLDAGCRRDTVCKSYFWFFENCIWQMFSMENEINLLIGDTLAIGEEWPGLLDAFESMGCTNNKKVCFKYTCMLLRSKETKDLKKEITINIFVWKKAYLITGKVTNALTFVESFPRKVTKKCKIIFPEEYFFSDEIFNGKNK